MVEDKKITDAQTTKENSNKRRRHCCVGLAVGVFILFATTIVFGAYLVSREKRTEEPIPIPKTEDIPDEVEKTDVPSKSDKKITSAPSVSDNNAIQQEKEKLLNFFVELANKDDSDDTWPGPIARWTKNVVSVGVGVGTFSAEQSSCLNSYIADINSVINGSEFVRDDTVDVGIPNIKIFYLPDADYQIRSQGTSPYGFATINLNDDNSISRGTVYISIEKIQSYPMAVQCQIIRHELTHALGFWGHSDIYPESIMSLPKTEYNFNAADKKVLEMHYNSGVPLGAGETEVRNYFANRDY